MFRKQQEAEKEKFYHSILGGIWKTVVEFPYTRWFWEEAESIRDRIKEWLELRSERASILFHEKNGMLHLKAFRERILPLHLYEELKIDVPMEFPLCTMDSSDWETLLEHPDKQEKGRLWEPSCYPVEIRERWGSWEKMWEEMEKVAGSPVRYY